MSTTYPNARVFRDEDGELAVELPDQLCDELHLGNGQQVYLYREGDAIILQTQAPEPWFTRGLKRLLRLLHV